jgi:hypothetical protein
MLSSWINTRYFFQKTGKAFTGLSILPEASDFPSGLKATEKTKSRCPSNERMRRPLIISRS